MTISRRFGDEMDSDEWERPAFQRHTRCIPLLQGTEDEAGSAMLEPRYRARRSSWTTTPPTEPGWWWARVSDQDIGMPVRVECFATGLCWTLGHAWQSVNLAGLLWSDSPLAEPGED